MRLSQRRKHQLPRPCACECDRWTPTKKRKKFLDINSDSPTSRSSNSSKPEESVPSEENGDDGGPSNEYGLRRSSRIRKAVNREPPPSHSPGIGRGGRRDGSLSKSPIGLGERMRQKRLRSPSLIVDPDASVDWDLRLRSRHKRPMIEEEKRSPVTGSKGRPRQSKRKLLRDIDECILRLDETKNNGSLVEESTRQMTDRFSVADKVGRVVSESDESTSSHGGSGQAMDLHGGRSSGVNNCLVVSDSCSHESSDDESSDTCIEHGRHSLRIFSKKKTESREKENSIADDEHGKFIGRSDDCVSRKKMPKTMVLRQDRHENIDKRSNLNELRMQKAGGPTTATAVVVVTHDGNNAAVKLKRDQLDESNAGVMVEIGEKYCSVANGDISVDNSGWQDVSSEHTEVVHNVTENQNVQKSDMISHLTNLEDSYAVDDSVHISQANIHCDASVNNIAVERSTNAKQPLSFDDTEMHLPTNLHNHPDASHRSDCQHDQADVHGVENQVKALPLDGDPQVDEHAIQSPATLHPGGSAIAENEGEINFMDAEKIVLSGIPGGDPDRDTIEDTSRNVASGTSVANGLVEKDKMDVNKLLSDKLENKDWGEGRRCGLCGCGVDGKPLKKWSHDCNGSDIEVYNLSASEEPNYDIWDGFGDEPGWLGRLLGPIHDRFGIAGVWVHQHCAVWSPEVYFSGVGCLKNVRAALCRGRALKCSRCGRPGATIGCRVDRCPRTYHLPCGRADGCVFDHRKFLIACTDHRSLFQPQGNQYLQRIKKLKVRKMKADTRKKSVDARRKDLEAEEKWLENCGEDEEFLKREGKRLHRDISRILPIYIGGSGGESLFQGWESVAGLEDVVRCLKEVVILPLLYPEYFSNLGLTPPRGVLLHGYPGTGKTLVVRALVGACSRGDRRIAYFARKGADCLGKYVGDAERQLRLLFHVAEKCQPSIIFFDEIDGLTPVRSKQQDQTHSSVVSTLLALLDGLKSRGSVIVIGATNRPDSIDPALRRPGRFDREIYFPLPSLKDRSAILALHTQKWPKAVSGSLSWRIAKETAGYAGADLQALCTQAAMIALKRNCPLQEILAAAEKQPCNGNRFAIPSFVVEEKDWLNALSCAPPPCSRREAGIAANDVVTYPLQADLVPYLLKPFVQLLVSMYLDEFIFLPPLLRKAGKKIKDILLSTMEGKQSSSNSWWSNLCYLLQESDTAEVEKSLSSIGLLGANILSSASESVTLDDDDCEISDAFDMKVRLSGISSNCAHLLEKKKTGFRVLISGSPRSGQKHLASCVLHGFEGNVEIHKLNLATISQEGRGDLLQGITNILMKCQRSGLSILYMPRIDLWAIDNLKCEPICTASGESGVSLENGGLSTSEAWNSLVGHIDSMCSTSLILVATCEMPSHVLPLRVRTFFKNDMLTVAPKTISARKEPFFLVNLDGRFNWDMMCNISAEKLSRDLIRLYVQIIHNKKHSGSKHFDTERSSFPTPRCQPDNQSGRDGTSIATHSKVLASKGSEHDLSMQCGDGDSRSFQVVESTVQSSVQPNHRSDSSISSHKTSIKMKSLQLAIATFGFQILKYPHFAELCWVTSKLKEGPCTDTYGPWKGWPFNSCIVRPCASQKSVAPDDRSAKNRSVESNSVVRGLVAVGLLAYRGTYKNVLEVALDIRKVLELLVAQIRAKILDGKDRYRFIPILSQVAYLEDMINTWAYSTLRLELDGQILDMDSQPSSKGSASTDAYEKSKNFPNETDKVVPANCKESHLNITEHGHVEDVKEFGPVTNSEDGGDAAFHKGTNPHYGSISSVRELGLGEEEMPVEMDLEHTCNAVKHIQTSGGDNILQIMQSTSNEISADGHVELEEANAASRQMLIGKLAFSEQSNADISTTICSSNYGIAGCADLSNGHAESKSQSFSLLSASCSCLCQYECCSKCLHLVYCLIHEVLMTRWEAGAHTTLEDAHDVVASCSAIFLAVIRNFYANETNNDMENAFSTDVTDQTLSRYCLCPVGSAADSKETSNWLRKMEMELVPTECSYHLEERSSVNAPFRSEFKVFIRDYAVLPSDAAHDVDLHCKFEHLCLCSLIRQLLELKNPL